MSPASSYLAPTAKCWSSVLKATPIRRPTRNSWDVAHRRYGHLPFLVHHRKALNGAQNWFEELRRLVPTN